VEGAAHAAGVRALPEGDPTFMSTFSLSVLAWVPVSPLAGIACSARRPFHPDRLHAFLTQHFELRQPQWEDDCAGGASNHSHGHHLHSHEPCLRHSHSRGQTHQGGSLQQAVLQASNASQQAAAAMHRLAQQAAMRGSDTSSQERSLLAAAAAATSAAAAASAAAALILSQLSKPGSAACSTAEAAHQPASSGGRVCGHHGLLHVSPTEAADRRSCVAGSFGQLCRSRGLIWLATRPGLCGEWSQVGRKCAPAAFCAWPVC
jgi:G3E family GTPase